MTERDLDLMNRYIYDVVRRIPRELRQETSMELEELIRDMVEEDGPEANVEEILKKLGDPSEFAKKYRDENRHLIGPEYYDNYIWILKIVLLCVAGSALVSFIINGITDIVGFDFDQLLSRWIETISNGIISLTSAFGVITFIFAVMEHQKVKLEDGKKQWTPDDLPEEKRESTFWTPKKLPPLPDKRSLIKRSESVAGIVFIMIFGVICIFVPQLFSAWWKEDGVLHYSSVFNLDKWNIILPFLLLFMGLGLIYEIIKLVAGRYCMTVAVSNAIIGLLQVALSAVVLKVLPFWNPNFISSLKEAYGYAPSSGGDILSYWNTPEFSNVLLLLIVCGTVLDIGITVYRTVRYGTGGQRT